MLREDFEDEAAAAAARTTAYVHARTLVDVAHSEAVHSYHHGSTDPERLPCEDRIDAVDEAATPGWDGRRLLLPQVESEEETSWTALAAGEASVAVAEDHLGALAKERTSSQLGRVGEAGACLLLTPGRLLALGMISMLKTVQEKLWA